MPKFELEQLVVTDPSIIDLAPGLEALLTYLWKRKINGEPVPSYKEIQKELYIKSKSTVYEQLVILNGLGFIKRTPGEKSAIQLDPNKVVTYIKRVDS